jgi:hypothetical protein
VVIPPSGRVPVLTARWLLGNLWEGRDSFRSNLLKEDCARASMTIGGEERGLGPNLSADYRCETRTAIHWMCGGAYLRIHRQH